MISYVRLTPILGLAFCPAGLAAQPGDDAPTADYKYAHAAAQQQQPSKQLEIELDQEGEGATRVIPTRQDGRTPVFVERPVVQPVQPVLPDRYAAPVATRPGEAPYGAPDATATPVPYTSDPYSTTRAPDAYVFRAGDEPVLPVGARIVQFDRNAWLTECARRLAPTSTGIDTPDRASEDYSRPADDGFQRCEAYLEGYMTSARSGALRGTPSPTGDYMLVPVTVMQPREARYSDGTPVRTRE